MNQVKPAAILLCAGRGTRMKDDRTHKVCYEIAGRPAILRLIDNLKASGVTRFVVVVGAKADKVMDCLDGVEGVVYAYQKTQNGTGNAAAIGLKALASTGYTGGAFVCMGDKIIHSDVFTALIERFDGRKAVFAVTPKEFNPSGGRVLMKDGRVCGIIERTDSYLRHLSYLLPLTDGELEKEIQKFGLDEKKRKQLFDKAKTLSAPIPTRLCGVDFDPSEIEEMPYVNAATYLVDTEKCISALTGIDSNNAQGELYMTDAINRLSETGDAEIVLVDQPRKLLTYSTMEELLKLGRYFSDGDVSTDFPKASVLLSKIEGREGELWSRFCSIYGGDSELIEERRDCYIKLLNAFIAKYGDREAVISRAPGRVNVMGRHIEHRGGSVNVMTINREMLCVASPRRDDMIFASNTDGMFVDKDFSILDHIGRYDTENWMEFIESQDILAIVAENRGSWINYIKSAVLRLQLADRSRTLCGMDMMFSGNIPMAAGLSSSSAIVVATMEACLALNKIGLPQADFIRLCGEGEWFVGSRGGAGDHAAMKCGRVGSITHLFFNPFSVGSSVPFPSDYRLIVANSYIEAKKSAGAKDVFNSKIAAYEFGLMLLKKNYPEFAEKMRVLKDVNPKTLSVPPSRIYEMLISLPERMTADEVLSALPEHKARIIQILKNHTPPESYDIRSVVLYGIAECERSEYCIECLTNGDIKMLGRLMNISHSGDRVWSDGRAYDYSANELYLYRLINHLKSENTERVNTAQLYNQPGGYACSTKEIDELVDGVCEQEGVLGAQLAGAGLGGCIMILVRKENAESVMQYLDESYYSRLGKPSGAFLFSVIEGSGVLC